MKNKVGDGDQIKRILLKLKFSRGYIVFSDLVETLTSQVEGFTITVNRTNGLINMIIPAGHEIFLPEAIRYLLGLEDDDSIGWLTAGEYEGDRAVEFSPKRLLVYLKQLSTSTNFESKNQRLEPSQLLGVITISSKKLVNILRLVLIIHFLKI